MSKAFTMRTDDNALTAVTVAISASTSGSSAANAKLEGGTLISCFAISSGGQIVVSAVLNSDGSVTVTLAGSDTASYTCIVQKK